MSCVWELMNCWQQARQWAFSQEQGLLRIPTWEIGWRHIFIRGGLEERLRVVVWGFCLSFHRALPSPHASLLIPKPRELGRLCTRLLVHHYERLQCHSLFAHYGCIFPARQSNLAGKTIVLHILNTPWGNRHTEVARLCFVFMFLIQLSPSAIGFLHLTFKRKCLKINGKEMLKHALSVTVTILMKAPSYFPQVAFSSAHCIPAWLTLTAPDKEIETDAQWLKPELSLSAK